MSKPKRKGFKRFVMKTGKRIVRALAAFQARHSTIGIPPVFGDAHAFAFTAPLEENWQAIHEELQGVLARRDQVPSFHQISPDQARISKGDDWKTFAFRIFKRRVEPNCSQCPRTDAVLARLDGLQNAWFSILAPGTYIPPHNGPTRALLRVHLGLMVPEPAEKCWIRVDQEIVTWQAGKVVVFDDTYEHEVHNDTDQDRVVLFMDFDRPMDWLGTLANRIVLGIMQLSPYVRDPLANLARWQKEHPASDPADAPSGERKAG